MHIETLKACPFCGERTALETWQNQPTLLVSGYVWDTYCRSCSAGVTGKSEAESVALWNRRTIVSLTETLKNNPALIDELLKTLDTYMPYNEPGFRFNADFMLSMPLLRSLVLVWVQRVEAEAAADQAKREEEKVQQ